MYPTFKPTTVNASLLTEVAQSTLSLDPVLFFYGGVAVVAVTLWVLGVLTFGRAAARPVGSRESVSPAAS